MTDFQIDVIYDKGTEDEWITCPRVCDFPEFLAQMEHGTPCDGELIHPDTIVITRDNITITFDYPLSTSAKLTFTKLGGFSRFDFFCCIYEGYKTIYDQEEDVDGDPGLIPGMLNRMSSNGPYGIWGHVMGDLYLEAVIDKGDGDYELGIGS